MMCAGQIVGSSCRYVTILDSQYTMAVSMENVQGRGKRRTVAGVRSIDIKIPSAERYEA